MVEVGKAMGINPDEILALFDNGWTRSEVEDLLYDPRLLHDLACELIYNY